MRNEDQMFLMKETYLKKFFSHLKQLFTNFFADRFKLQKNFQISMQRVIKAFIKNCSIF